MLEKYYIKFLSPVVINMANLAFSSTGEQLFLDMSPYDFVMGRPIKLFKMVDTVGGLFRSLGIPMPGIKAGNTEIKNGTFGVFRSRMDNEDGPFELYTGQTDDGAFSTYASILDKRSVELFHFWRTISDNFFHLESWIMILLVIEFTVEMGSFLRRISKKVLLCTCTSKDCVELLS